MSRILGFCKAPNQQIMEENINSSTTTIATIATINVLRPCHTLQKRIPARALMRNHRLICTVPRKDDAIRAGAAPAKRALVRQNGKLVVRPSVGERKAFPVVVLMRVVVADG